MGPCKTCGQPTESDADFCPACGGYPAPATVYSYAPGRVGQSWDDAPAPRLAAAQRTPRVADPDSIGTEAYSARTANLASSLEVRYNSRRTGRRIALAATLTVVLAAGGTAALALTLQSRTPPRPATAAHPGRSVSPAATSGRAASSAPAAIGGEVAVAPSAAGAPDQAAVVAFLNSYFTAINQHDYAAYQQLFSPAARAGESAAAFQAGYGTTTDSDATLLGVSTIGVGELAAQVRFTSHQQASGSATNSSCTAWTVSLYLLPQGGQYELVPPPSGYQPSASACS